MRRVHWQPTTAGRPARKSACLNNSVKYVLGMGPARFALMHQFGSDAYVPQNGNQVDAGLDLGGFSMDVLYGLQHGAVSATSLTAAQLATGVPANSLAATVSDNTSYSVLASYNA